MLEEKILNKDFDVIVNMKEYGDAFVQSLADCLFYAGTEDFKTLKKVFSNYWEEYKNFKP
jgi:hypothetical protein